MTRSYYCQPPITAQSRSRTLQPLPANAYITNSSIDTGDSNLLTDTSRLKADRHVLPLSFKSLQEAASNPDRQGWRIGG
jgi:hypothetical protein